MKGWPAILRDRSGVHMAAACFRFLPAMIAPLIEAEE
jgi:hypothetical protein